MKRKDNSQSSLSNLWLR